MYTDYEEHFNLLTDEEVGKLMRAIIKYEKTRYRRIKKTEEEEGDLKKKKMEKRKKKMKQKKTNGLENNQSVSGKPNGFFENPKNPILINDNDNDTDTDTDTVISSINSEDVATFEYETKLKVLFSIPALNDRDDKLDPIINFIKKVNL